jgi:hypothetical protein
VESAVVGRPDGAVRLPLAGRETEPETDVRLAGAAVTDRDDVLPAGQILRAGELQNEGLVERRNGSDATSSLRAVASSLSAFSVGVFCRDFRGVGRGCPTLSRNPRSVRIFGSLALPGIFASLVVPVHRVPHLRCPTVVSNCGLAKRTRCVRGSSR